MTVAPLAHRHRRRRPQQTRPRSPCPGCRFRRNALSAVNRFQIVGQRPGRARSAGIVLLQKEIEREVKAPLGEPARAAMAGRAALGKQLCRRLAPIEVLRQGDRSAECSRDHENKKTAAQFVGRHRVFPMRTRRPRRPEVRKRCWCRAICWPGMAKNGSGFAIIALQTRQVTVCRMD